MYRRAGFTSTRITVPSGVWITASASFDPCNSTESPAPGAPLGEVRSLSPQVACAPDRSGAPFVLTGAPLSCVGLLKTHVERASRRRCTRSGGVSALRALGTESAQLLNLGHTAVPAHGGD